MSTDIKDDRLNRRLQAIKSAATATPAFGQKKPPSKKSEKRTRDRTPTFRVGRIVYSGQCEAACVIKDFSDTGAKVVLEGEIALPPRVGLVISQAGIRRVATVIWQDEREVGLSFDSAT